MVLSDNSLAFTGRKLGSVVLFEKNLISLGIKPIWSSSRHPQTCGKNERGHHTARRWLSRRPPAVSLAELQQLLDRYRGKFNHRPHQALHGATPLEQRAASTRTTPRPGLAPSYPTTVSTHTATSHGAIGVSGVMVGLGVEYAGQHLTCVNTNDHVLIFYKHHLVHEFTIDRSHNYHHPPTTPRRKAAHPPPVTNRPHAARFLHRCQPSRRACAVKEEPTTGGTTLTAPSTGTQSQAEEPATHLHFQTTHPLSAMASPLASAMCRHMTRQSSVADERIASGCGEGVVRRSLPGVISFMHRAGSPSW